MEEFGEDGSGTSAASWRRVARRPGRARMPSVRMRSLRRAGVIGRPGRCPGNSHGLGVGEPTPRWLRPTSIRSVSKTDSGSGTVRSCAPKRSETTSS